MNWLWIRSVEQLSLTKVHGEHHTSSSTTQLRTRAKNDSEKGNFVEFQSDSLSIYYRISIVVHGSVWIFSGIAQYLSQLDTVITSRTHELLH